MEPKPTLYRYLPKIWAEKFVHEGLVAFRHASKYNDPSLPPAKRDNEQVRSFNFEDSKEKVFLHDKAGNKLHLLKMEVRLTNTNSLKPRDYFVLCWSVASNDKMFVEFDADACILLKDPEELQARIMSHLKSAFPDGGKFGNRFRSDSVKYFFPNEPLHLPDLLDYQFWKPAEHAWEREFRMVVEIADVDVSSQEWLVIHLGDLSDICEVCYNNV